MKSRWSEKSKIAFEPWKTPLSSFDKLLYIGNISLHKIHFILEIGDGSGKLVVVSIPGNMPFRIVDETYLEDIWHRLEKKIRQRLKKEHVL